MGKLSINHALFGGILALSSVTSSAANATTTYNWSFVDQSSNQIGNGTLTTVNNIVVTGMKGTLNGQKITFYQNKPTPWTKTPNNLNLQINNPVPGVTQVVNIPNTTGANIGYDDIYDFNNGVTYFGGLCISTGKGASLRVSFLTRDSQAYDINTPTDIFSVNPDGSYSQIEGTFSVTPIPAP